MAHEEQDLVDGLISSLRTGSRRRVEYWGAELVDCWENVSAEHRAVQDSEVLLRFDSKLLKVDAERCGLLAGRIPEKRIAKLSAGAAPTANEQRLWATLVATERFEGGFGATSDHWETWCIAEARGSTGATVFVAFVRRGNDFPCDTCFLAAHEVESEAIGALKRFVYVNLDDFRERYPVSPGERPRFVGENREEMERHGYCDEWQYLRLCGTCDRLFERDRPDGQNQTCACRPGARESWSGWDIAERACLCLCCGLTVLESGSRFSPFFCGTCREFAVGVSLWHRRLIFPIGRHSLMNGFVPGTLPATLAAHGRSVRKLAVSLHAQLEGIAAGADFLERWHSRVMSHNRQVLAAEGEMGLDEYVSAAARDSRLTPYTAFAAMSEFVRELAATRRKPSQ